MKEENGNDLNNHIRHSSLAYCYYHSGDYAMKKLLEVLFAAFGWPPSQLPWNKMEEDMTDGPTTVQETGIAVTHNGDPQETGIYVVYLKTTIGMVTRICYGWRPSHDEWYDSIWLVPGTEEY